MWLARHLQLGALGLELAEQPGVEDRQRRLAGERLAAARTISASKRARRPPADHQRARRSGRRAASAPRAPTASRRRSRTSRCGSSSTASRSATWSGRRSSAARPTRVDVPPDRDARAAGRPARAACRSAARTKKASSASSYSMIEPPSVPVSRTALATIRLQHLVEVEARADRLADLAERLELLDLAGQLGAPRLQRAHQLDLAQRDRRLGRELVEQPRSPVVERRDLVRHMDEHADDLVVQHHRRATAGCGTRRSAGGPGARTRGRPARRRSAGYAGPPRPGPPARPGRGHRVVRDVAPELRRDRRPTIRDSRKRLPSTR